MIDQAGSLPPRDRSTVLLFLTVLSVVVLLVLATACANVANLMLIQTASRQREMAVRISLGASRGALLRQMLMESVLLALGGGVLGTLISLWATSALSAFQVPAPVPLDISLSVDWRVVLYTFVLSVVTGFLCGLVPAWIASRPVLTRALKGEDALARPGRRITLRNSLAVAQIAISLVLLSAAGLFLRSLVGASSIDIGFRSRNVVMVSVDPRIHGYSPERTTQFLALLRERVAAMPGVVSVAATDSVPLSGGNRSDALHADGQPQNGPDPGVELYMATPGYFETLGIPRLTGRDFGNESPTGPKVAIINEALAEHLYGRTQPDWSHVFRVAARRITLSEWSRILNRAAMARKRGMCCFVRWRRIRAAIHLSWDISCWFKLPAIQGAVIQATRAQIRALDPNMAVYGVETMREHLSKALFLPRLAGTLFGVFGFIGLTLAAVGLYGVISYSVAHRTHEIGIRLALGAPLSAIRGLVLRQGMSLIVIAIAIGMPAAWFAAKFSRSFLYGVRPHDPITFVVVPLFLAAIALVACWVPARRASKTDPQTALRLRVASGREPNRQVIGERRRSSENISYIYS